MQVKSHEALVAGTGEISVKKIRHPNVVRLIEVIDDILDEKIYLGNLSCSLGRIYPATTHSL